MSYESARLEPLAYRVGDACAVLGIGRTSLYELIAAGKLRAVCIAGRTLIPVESARALVANASKDKADAG
jgi:excisionase family DNA binding protein